MVGYITESEADYINSKSKKMEKFNEVFDFYHETVPREQPAQPVPEETKRDEENNGVQTLDPPAPTEEKPEVKAEEEKV